MHGGEEMTFDFSPDLMDRISTATECSGAASKPVDLSPLAPPAPCAPAQPTDRQIAALVEELFTEGTLSYEQLRSLSKVPELSPLLSGALEGVPAGRRLRASR